MQKQILIVIFMMFAYFGKATNTVHAKDYTMLPRHSSYSLTTPPDSLVVIAPNVFTPNNDGVNDYWSIILHDYGIAILELQTTVYDRWGKEVFHTTNVHQVWNGNNHIGKACEDGTYFFIVTFTNGKTKNKEVFKGFLELLR
jgi:gliding motility-associated-like protein